MKNKIKTIEDLSLNAWPSIKYRFMTVGFCVFLIFIPIAPTALNRSVLLLFLWHDKLDYCEEIYEKWGSPAIYKINPLIDSSFDQKLTQRNYYMAHVTEVMTMELLKRKPANLSSSVILRSKISPAWLNALFSMKGTNNQIHRTIVPSMYAAIPKDTIAAYVYDRDQIIATGLGILDRDYIGLYAIHVHENYRGQGIGRNICCS